MVKLLFDTNILVDYLNAVTQAKVELELYSEKAISAITWMEVMVGTTPKTEAGTRAFLATFERLSVDEDVCELAVALRKQHKIKLPDAIVWSTAQVHNLQLVTRNTKDFDRAAPGIRVPYEI